MKSTDLGALKPAIRSRAQAITASGSGRRAGVGHDDGLHRLAPARVRHADHRGVGDARAAQDRVLHLGRVDVLAAETIMSFTRSWTKM